MTWVIDASVALKWFVQEDGSEPARQLLVTDEALIAPDIVIAEVLNAAWRLNRVGSLGATQYVAISNEIANVFDDLSALRPLAARAAAIAQSLDHPVYDCFYLALAERENARLVSADARLLEKISETEFLTRASALSEFRI